jgi:hypothetical protein
MKKSLISLAVFAAITAHAQQTTNVTGDNTGKVDQQNIGDTTTNQNDINSQSTQLGNSANANGATITTNADTRDQNTFNPTATTTSHGGSAHGGSAHGNKSDNDNRSSVGNVGSASTIGNAQLGTSSVGAISASNGNNTNGPNSNGDMTGGNNTNTVDALGGAGGHGGSAKQGQVALGGSNKDSSDRSDNSTRNFTGANEQGQGQSSENALILKSSNTLSNGSSSNSQGGTGGSSSSQTGASTSSAQTGASTSNGGSSSSQTGASTSQGGASGGNTMGLAGSGNSTTTVDAADRSTTNYSSRAVTWAPVIHGPAAPALAAANVVVVPGVCGPRVVIARQAIEGVRFGVWGGQTSVQQGYDEVAQEADQPFLQQGPYLMGHIVVTYTAVVGTSSGGSLSVGGFGRSGDGAQGGGSTSGAMQQVVQRVTARACIFAQETQEKPVVVPVPVPVEPRVVYVEVPVKPKAQ